MQTKESCLFVCWYFMVHRQPVPLELDETELCCSFEAIFKMASSILGTNHSLACLGLLSPRLQSGFNDRAEEEYLTLEKLTQIQVPTLKIDPKICFQRESLFTSYAHMYLQ